MLKLTSELNFSKEKGPKMDDNNTETGDVKQMKLDMVELQRLGESRLPVALNFIVRCSESDSHHLIVEKVKLHSPTSWLHFQTQ